MCIFLSEKGLRFTVANVERDTDIQISTKIDVWIYEFISRNP